MYLSSQKELSDHVRRPFRQAFQDPERADAPRRAHGRGRQRGAARGPPRPARGRRGARGRALLHRQGARRAVGAEVVKSVSPGQQVVKIVHDQLVEMLGADAETIDLNAAAAGRHPDGRPAGLGQDDHHRQDRQAPDRPRDGARADGLARHAPPGRDGAARGAGQAGRRRHAADRRRPVAGADRPPRHGGGPLGGYDVVMLDTAGRVTHRRGADGRGGRGEARANPHEMLLVADASPARTRSTPPAPSTSASASPASC